METLTQWIPQITKLTPLIQRNLFTSLVIILILWLLRTVVMSIVLRRVEDVRLRYRWRKTSKGVAAALGVVLVGSVWFEGIQYLASILVVAAVGLLIALKDVVTAIAGWFYVIWRRPFNVGDRIQIGEHAGDVIDVRIFKFTLMEIGNWVDADQSTGRLLHIPNGLVLSEVVSNYSSGFQYIWNELPVMVTFESNWTKAKTILLEIVTKHAQHSSEAAQKRIQEASRRFMIFYSVLTPTVYTSIAESGVLLTIRYLCEPRTRRGTSETIWEDVLNQFAAHQDINFAYPTRRFYDKSREGELGTRPSTVLADS
ncbi:MAG: mechanosensitive ion channel [Candidatus Poribacteria bacterium]|nr:mechanosensitive ion channel [Candidatus Poribacteria bacterium]MDE0504046.1 mechanosensitive ion channel [Candidatus Poribacteria bacterium]